MRLPLITLFAALLVIPLSSAAQSPPAVATRSDIEAAYDHLNAAFAQHDLTRFMSYFAPDYIVVDKKGAKHNKEQARQQYEGQLRQIRTFSSHYVIQDLVSTPSGTVVEMKMHTAGTGERRVLFAKLVGGFSDDLRVRDLWVSTPEGWRLKVRQTLQDDMSLRVR